MSTYAFKSFLASEFASYLEHRKNSGYKTPDSSAVHLRRFDEFIAENCTGNAFTKEHAEKWIEKNDDESQTAHYIRVNSSKNFFLFIYPRVRIPA